MSRSYSNDLRESLCRRMLFCERVAVLSRQSGIYEGTLYRQKAQAKIDLIAKISPHHCSLEASGIGRGPRCPKPRKGGQRSEATRPLRIPELRWGSQSLIHATKPDQAWCRAWSGCVLSCRCGWGAGTSRFLPSVRLLRWA